jgi:hypothetical protein
MPKIAIKHESWCTDHSNDEGRGEVCSSAVVYFGPYVPTQLDDSSQEYQAGSFQLSQCEMEDEVQVGFEYVPGLGWMNLATLRSLYAALDANAWQLLEAMRQTIELIDGEGVTK